jgi:carboxyl-terminal processing protease
VAAGLRPGNVITHIGGLALGTARSRVALRPVEEKFQLRRMALRQLSGPAGTTVTIRYAGDDKRPAEAVLLRQPIATAPERVGHLGPVYPRVSVRQVGHVGIIAFNFFLMEPVLKKVSDAIEGFRQRKVTAIVLDLRGNPGGMAAMAIPLAARLSAKPVALGTIQFRDHQNALTANPSLDVQPFLGPVFILTDEGTASTAEILAAGLQEAKRATIVGELTLGAALPSAVEELPGGAVLQYVVADFKTPSGAALEGRGVAPDRRVVETRAALAAGRDVVLDAALELARASRTR